MRAPKTLAFFGDVLAFLFFRAPAALAWALKTVESMNIMEQSAWSEQALKIAFQMPRAPQANHRLWTVRHLPISWGSSRQGAPVFPIQRMASMNARKSGILRPRGSILFFSAMMIGPKAAHCLLERRWRLEIKAAPGGGMVRLDLKKKDSSQLFAHTP